MIIDAKDKIVGRLATFAAKQALLGERVYIVNCEKAVISGGRKDIVEHYIKRLELGQPRQGPVFPRNPDRFVRRIVRGMLPFKTRRGRTAHGRVKCYTGHPEDVKGDAIDVSAAYMGKLPNVKYMRVNDVCRLIGGKQ